MKKNYTIIKANNKGEITLETIEKINGYKVKPKNKCNYLDDKYVNLLHKKISLIEHEIKLKKQNMIRKETPKKVPVMDYEEEIVEERHRRR